MKNLSTALKTMYDNNSNKDILGAAIAAALGSGMVTSLAMSQGQHSSLPLHTIGLAVLVALVCDRLGLI